MKILRNLLRQIKIKNKRIVRRFGTKSKGVKKPLMVGVKNKFMDKNVILLPRRFRTSIQPIAELMGCGVEWSDAVLGKDMLHIINGHPNNPISTYNMYAIGSSMNHAIDRGYPEVMARIDVIIENNTEPWVGKNHIRNLVYLLEKGYSMAKVPRCGHGLFERILLSNNNLEGVVDDIMFHDDRVLVLLGEMYFPQYTKEHDPECWLEIDPEEFRLGIEEYHRNLTMNYANQ